MTYRVELTARDLNGLEKAIYTLEAYPLRCAAAPESKKAPSLRQEAARLPRHLSD